MELSLSTLELFFLILKVVRNIENSNSYDSNVNIEYIEYSNHFFNAFDGKVAKKRDWYFLFDLGALANKMICNEHLNGDKQVEETN